MMTIQNERVDSDPSQPEGTIALDQFLKLMSLVQSGGHAKRLIQSGEVLVNGSKELRRGRKLRLGDTVQFEGIRYVVEADSTSQ